MGVLIKTKTDMKQLLLLFLFTGCFNKENINYFTFEKVILKNIPKIEAHFHSKLIQVKTPIYISPNYLPESYDFSPYPLLYVRDDESFNLIPKVEVLYHYTEIDSVLRLITYTWHTTTIGKDLKEINSDFDDNLDEFNSKYNSIYSDLTTSMGEPFVDTSNVLETHLEKIAKWKKNNTIVELKLIFTQGIERLGTHRIRVKVYWIN